MPTPARLDVETTLYDRWQGSLVFVYQRSSVDPILGTLLDAATNRPVVPTGTTEVYNDPIAYGLQVVGLPAANPALVVDADVAGVAPRWIAFTDLAEYRLILNLLGSFTDVTEADFGRSASYDQLASRWVKRVDQLMSMYKSYLSPFRAGASSGAIRNTPSSAFPPRWGPGYGGPFGRRGFGPWGC